MRSAFSTDKKMQLGNLPEYWRAISQEFKRLEGLPDLATSRVLSARTFDESQVAGPRTYIEVTRYLNVARDNHEALLALLEHHGATLWAPWSLLRPVFETSFLAAWILDPEDGLERRARGLRCEILDSYEQRRHRAAFKAVPEVRELIESSEQNMERGSLSTYRAEALELRRRFDKLNQKINVIAELPKLTFVAEQKQVAPFLEATWRQLSGFEHGCGWALLSGSDHTIEAHIPGGAGMQLVINDEAFVNAAKSTYFLLLSACRLLRRRHFEPSHR